MALKRIKKVADLLKHLKNDGRPDAGPRWFRGHSNREWALLSAYDRLVDPPKETQLLNKFRQNANLLIREQYPNTDFDWMFLMQHYGVPTRLLDWSESPLVALYFSLEMDNEDTRDEDAILWVLYPYLLNAHSWASGERYIPAFEDTDYLGSYSVEQYAKGTDSGILPIAAIATRNNARIQAQLGAFTISHREKKPIESIGDKKHVTRYLIPAEYKQALHEELKVLAFNKFQIFPELASVGDIIKEELL